MAFIEEDGPLAGLLDPFDQFAAVGMEQAQELVVVCGLSDLGSGHVAQARQVRPIMD